MSGINLQLKLLSGRVIYIDDIPTYKIPLNQIIDFGYVEYQNLIRLICMEKDEINKMFQIENEIDDVFTFLFVMCMQDFSTNGYSFSKEMLRFLQLIFNKDVKIDIEHGFVIGESHTLNRENFSKLQEVIKYRNSLNDIEEENNDNPADEATRQLIEKRNKLRKKIKELKKTEDDNEPITLFDLISIYAEMEKMKIEDVCEYDFFQFNNQFNRMKVVEDFKVNVQSLLAGADSKSIKLKHWLSKLKDNNENED